MAEFQIKILGYYILDTIYESTRTIVYKGLRESDQMPVVLKLLRSEHPTLRELAQFRNQYNIAKKLDNLPGIIRTYSLENYRNGYALVMEDFGGISLKEWGGGYKNNERMEEFLNVAIQIASALDILYRHRVIHKDIKPANILIEPVSGEVKIIDFSIASLLPREIQSLTNPDVLEGTLPYMSPEQTGRMNRGIDYRTDFYSLGVTFYELLTGELPFSITDPMELVHCHIAKQPVAASDIDPSVPAIISKIISRLMAKNAEDRYQSALGLKYDLEICLHQWQTSWSTVPFELGLRDICDRFIVPEKLYGRTQEVESLLDAVDRVSQGSREVMLVSGASGVGKTAVVNEVHKPIVRQRGYFIEGKFDQFQRSAPLSAIAEALGNLIDQLLMESTQEVEEWKAKIQAAVGDNGQVIIDVIPEVELLIGKQPAAYELEASASQNRFNLVFQKFIQIFPSASHPLVIFIDDLQWANSASLNLIQSLMSNSETQYLLLIGAYRDNEVNPAHPLMLTVNEIQKNNTIVNNITLTILSVSDLNCLVVDTLHCTAADASSLTQLVFTKTQGNPFFSIQFLKSLHEDEFISFDYDLGCWRWDVAKIDVLSLTDNVVEFMSNQLQKLPSTTQEYLKIGACIGNKFDVKTLAIVYDKSLSETITYLEPALQIGLIILEAEAYNAFANDGISVEEEEYFQSIASYKFLHDRVQQAAYNLIDECEKKSIHLKTGQLLLNKIVPAEREENIFEIVNQLNLAVELIDEQNNRDELAQLNLIAGRKAKASTAYTDAFKYLTIGIELLTTNSWERDYEPTLALYEIAAEVAYLIGDFEHMESLVETVLVKSKTLLDKVKAYQVRIEAFKAQNQGFETIKTGLEVLSLFGITFPKQVDQEYIRLKLETTQSALASKSIEDLIDLPHMINPEKLAVMNILGRLQPITYMCNPPLFILVVLEQVSLSLEYGNCVVSALSYASYGTTLWNLIGDIDSSYRFGKLGLNLLECFNATETKCIVHFVFNTFIRHWRENLRESLKPLLEAYSIGLKTGDLEQAAFSIYMYSEHSFFIGRELIELEKEIAKSHEAINKLNQKISIQFIAVKWQTVLNLIGKVDDPRYLRGEAYNEKTMLILDQKTENQELFFYIYVNQLLLCYLFQDYQQASQQAAQAEDYLDAVPAKLIVAIFYFYKSLTMLALYSNAKQDEQEHILEQVSEDQNRMKTWADYAPMNYLHKYYLVEAEKYRVLGYGTEAAELYDRAITLAQENAYINEEALAQELAAKFYLTQGKKTIAQSYMSEAYNAYERWGAKAKLDDLAQRYPNLIEHIIFWKDITLNPYDDITSTTNTSVSSNNTKNSISISSSISASLDLTTVIKGSQAISQSIHLEDLLSTLMRVVLENAGAQTGALILCKGNNFVIEAQAFSVNNERENLQITCLKSIPVEESQDIPISLINYVAHTNKTLVINDIGEQIAFASEPYIIKHQPKSVLCMMVYSQSVMIGILYLENKLTKGAFTCDRLQVLNLLITQAAISLKNAILYRDLTLANKKLDDDKHDLEQIVAERTKELNAKNQNLSETLNKLQHAQAQLIQTEKMSGLGQMIAGIAHEINNPINFIHGNISHARIYIEDLMKLGSPGWLVISFFYAWRLYFS